MNMKKLVALLLALVMVFALCACGSKDAKDTDKKDDGKKTAMKADDIPDETDVQRRQVSGRVRHRRGPC